MEKCSRRTYGLRVNVDKTKRYGCISHICSLKEKLEFKKGDNVLQEVEKFCYLGDLTSCYGGASKAVRTRTCSEWEKFRDLKGVVV